MKRIVALCCLLYVSSSNTAAYALPIAVGITPTVVAGTYYCHVSNRFLKDHLTEDAEANRKMMLENGTFRPFVVGAALGAVPMTNICAIAWFAADKINDWALYKPVMNDKKGKAFAVGLACGTSFYIPLILKYCRR